MPEQLIANWHGLGAQFVVTKPNAKARVEAMVGIPIGLHASNPGSAWLRRAVALLAPVAAWVMPIILGRVR